MAEDQIIWINHAGYELRTGGLRIVVDPWLSGRAFNDGWSLLAPTAYRADDFDGVDYIWFSHEHPDHFSPPSLKQIPEAARRSITVLYQQTRDHRVADFCRKLGFRVRELPDGKKIQLNEDVAITCGVSDEDSWSLMEGPERRYFNANDVVHLDWRTVASRLPQVDVLLTQFSYANWVGNRGDTERMQKAAQRKISEMEMQIAAFRPTTVIPFASFVWFSAEENYHMNAEANSPRSIFERFSPKIETVILHPGDAYLPGKPHDSSLALDKYDALREALPPPVSLPAQNLTREDLAGLVAQHQALLKKRNAMWMAAPLSWAGYLRPVDIFLTDSGFGVRYSMLGGLLRTDVQRQACDIAMTSGSFAFVLKQGFGFSTLHVNGRFEELKPGAILRLSRHFAIAAQNEAGFTFPGMLLKTGYIRAHLQRLVHRGERPIPAEYAS